MMTPTSTPTTSWWRSPSTFWGPTGCPRMCGRPTRAGSSGYWSRLLTDDDRRIAVHCGGHLLHGISGYDHRRDGSAANGAIVHGWAQRGEPRDVGLYADAGGLDSGERLDRRPLRIANRVRRSAGGVHRRIDPLRIVDGTRLLHGGTRAAGDRRRHDGAGRPYDRRAQYRQKPADEGHFDDHVAGDRGSRRRSDGGRLHHHVRVVALGVLSQCTVRTGGAGRDRKIRTQSAGGTAPADGLRRIRIERSRPHLA